MIVAKKKLSVIIPCYNCSKTLREAVESCYIQGFSEQEFEIVMVDDGSIDNTKTLMEELAAEHSNIRIFFHGENKGGGAARNTATEHSAAEVIFCLDSDDILSAHMLHKMVLMQEETRADGIGIEKSVKFQNGDVNDIVFTNIFGYRNELIPLESLLQNNDVMCPLYSTFLYTKTAFNRIHGYPTEHGFDTQGFAWRFLAEGLKAYTCPDTTYYHRVNFHESYYLKEYSAGRTNLNWKKILLEENRVLTDEAFQFVLNFNASDFEKNIFTELKKIPRVFSSNLQHRSIDFSKISRNSSIRRDSLRGILYRIRIRVINKLLNK